MNLPKSQFKWYINLIKELSLSDFKLFYQGSILGYLWSFLKPLMLFGTLYLVFSVFLKFEIENFSLYLLLGIILWNYLAESTTTSIKNLLNKRSLITRVYFPRILIIIASSVTSLITLLLNLVVFVIFFIFNHITPTINILWTIIILILLYTISLGMSLLISSLNLKFRDLSHIWDITLQMGFWATPIIYSIDMIPEKYHSWLFVNPMARIIQYFRQVVINGEPLDIKGVLILTLMSISIFTAGWLIFKKRESKFAEEI